MANLVHCYNRGCGKKFDPANNKEDECIYHPGAPVFHDAYKIWPCCNKKSIDFSEFLNIKGCTKAVHSDVKPAEPVKVVDKSKADEVIEVCVKPLNNEPEVRPPFDSPQTVMTPHISAAVQQLAAQITSPKSNSANEEEVQIGQSCKRSSCNGTYQGPQSDEEVCVHHPGVPIFHEGMKYWSCCNKKTADFGVFLAQPGCTKGNHAWFSKDSKNDVKCRMDWHQTGTNVVISIYAKKYLPASSKIKLSPVRLTVDIYFPEVDSKYNLDIELFKPINVEKSKVSMLPSKVEITLIKTGPEHWTKLEIPRQKLKLENQNEKEQYEDKISEDVNAVDLSDL